jgi:K+-transporting ATPase ATPase C chain
MLSHGELLVALRASVATFLLCAVVYPAVVWGGAQLVFPWQADGSLIYGDDRSIIGSRLVGQRFESDRYFHGRPSAVDYRADAAGASNLSTSNPALRTLISERIGKLKGTKEHPVPVDLVMASGSGLDPEISLKGASYQASRVAAARGVPIETVRRLIEQAADRSDWILGAPARVNVLELNLALEKALAPSTH